MAIRSLPQPTDSRTRTGRLSPLWNAARSSARRLRGTVVQTRTACLTVAGFGCIDAGLFQLSVLAGLVTTGLSLVLLAWLVED